MRSTLIIVLLTSFIHVFGQTEKNHHRIDIELDSCLNIPNNYSTKGMIDCILSATEKWDKELNKNYKELMALLHESQKSKLKDAQLKWIEFRDKELEFSKKLFYDMQGTMWSITAAQVKMDLTKQRTLELKEYIRVLTLE